MNHDPCMYNRVRTGLVLMLFCASQPLQLTPVGSIAVDHCVVAGNSLPAMTV